MGRIPQVGDEGAFDGRIPRLIALDGRRVAAVRLLPPGPTAIRRGERGDYEGDGSGWRCDAPQLLGPTPTTDGCPPQPIQSSGALAGRGAHARLAAACQRGSSQRAPSTNAEPLRPAASCTRIASNRCASMPAYISHRPYTPRTQASSVRSTASSSRTAAQKACGVTRLAECRCGPRARPSMAALLTGDPGGVRSPHGLLQSCDSQRGQPPSSKQCPSGSSPAASRRRPSAQ